MPTAKSIISYVEELAPLSLAMPGDPVGLQLGDPGAEIKKIIVSLDPDSKTIKAAIDLNAEMIVTHHPLFFNSLTGIDESLPQGALVAEAVRNHLNIYSAHTNFDIAPFGVTDQLVEILELPIKDKSVLEVTANEQLLKLVAYVPVGHEDIILEALAESGAGQIGRYSHCTFQVAGTGTFLPGEDTTPFIGSGGRLEKTDEIRLETILPVTHKKEVITSLLRIHPYEEVAYDLYPLDLEGEQIGMGLLLYLEKPVSIGELVANCSAKLPFCTPRFQTFGKKDFTKIALCGGSGGSMIETAGRQGAELFISGDFKYHDLKRAEQLGLALVDAGHVSTEMPGIYYLGRYLQERLKQDGFGTEVTIHSSFPTVWDLS